MISSGLISVEKRAMAEMQRPLELDLEAAFKAMEEDVMREVSAAVELGATPDEVIRLVNAVLAED